MSRLRLLLAGLLGALYLWGLAPSVHVHDAGELTSAAWTLGVGHPPGSPLYMLLSKAFLLLAPLGSIAWRANLFSALMAVGAFFAFDALARRVTGRDGLSLTGACAFALTATFWSQAEMAEVYTLQSLLLLLFFWAFACAAEGECDGRVAALVWGLLLACHVGLAPLTPAVLLLIPREPGSQGLWGRLRGAVRLLPAMALPLLLYAYVPIRSLADPLVDWGNPETPQALWWHLTNRAVRGRMLSLPWQEYLHRGWEYLGILSANLIFLLPLALLGLVLGWRHRRPLALLLALVVATDAAFVVLMDTAPLASEAYAIPSVVALALLAVWGLSSLRGRVYSKCGVALVACTAALSLGLNLKPNDLHRNFLARDAAESLLAQVPPGATLLAQEDSTTNALAYLCLVEGARPDLEIFDRFGNLFGSLYDRPPFTVAAADRPAFRRSREEPAILSRVAQGKEVYFSTPHLDYSSDRFRLAPGEFAARACAEGASCLPPVENLFPSPRAGDHPDWMSRQLLAELATRKAEACLSSGRAEEARTALTEALVLADIPELFLLCGQQARRAGSPELALLAAREAIRRRVGFAPALYLKGASLADLGRVGEAEEALLAAAAADFALPQPHALLGQLAARRGDWSSAHAAFSRALERDPGQPDLLHDRAKAALALGDNPSAEGDLRAALGMQPGHLASRLRLVKLLGDSGRLSEAGDVLCGGCGAGPASEWPAPALKELLLGAARAGFPPCIGRWLLGSQPLDDEGKRLAKAYSAAEAQVHGSDTKPQP